MLLQTGDTASYALIPSPLVHTATVPVPAGAVAVNVVQSKDNVTVITDNAHAGATALTTLSAATPNWQSWVVHSENKITGAYTEFTSTTGKYADNTNPTPVGSAYTPEATGIGSGTGGNGGTGGTGARTSCSTTTPTLCITLLGIATDTGASNGTICVKLDGGGTPHTPEQKTL